MKNRCYGKGFTWRGRCGYVHIVFAALWLPSCKVVVIIDGERLV